MTFVTKADGTKQVFDKNKIIRTCLRLRLNQKQAEEVANEIESKIYDGIHTKEILEMIFKLTEKYRPSLKHQIDLKESISLLRPKPDFEAFVNIVFKNLGYKTGSNLILEGKCVEHEVDVIAEKDDEVILVEVKHHLNPHKYVGLDVFLQINATLEDLKEGFNIGKHKYNFSKALVICNTKISEHAKKYSKCKKIEAIAWNYPEGRGLERIIEENKIYPITFLRDIKIEEIYSLCNAGFVTFKQMMGNPKEISAKSGISLKRIEELQKLIKFILES
ncbi:MAG: restriction endonuclease [Candidatus Aenigmarchaeota archaeon]|nr:restriction endonuclease [Candidatus Aenigmarchaeota archaeon]